MRIAFLSDIHGNYTAFEAVIKDLETQNIDQFISLGDTITMGPQPMETLHKLKNLGCKVYVKGNHDWAVLNPEQAEKFEITPHLIADLTWCHNQLGEEDVKFIESFVDTAQFTLPNGLKILAFHGSPFSSTDVIHAATPVEELEKYFGTFDADIFIGGHSHVQMVRRHGEKLILNTGSIGNAFKFIYTPGNPPSLLPWAEYLILEDTEDSIRLDARRVYFDTEKVHQAASASGMPGTAWWLSQYQKVKT